MSLELAGRGDRVVYEKAIGNRAVVPAADADQLVQTMREHPLGRDAAVIGEVVSDHPGMVIMKSLVGGERVVTMLAGEQLPRIC